MDAAATNHDHKHLRPADLLAAAGPGGTEGRSSMVARSALLLSASRLLHRVVEHHETACASPATATANYETMIDWMRQKVYAIQPQHEKDDSLFGSPMERTIMALFAAAFVTPTDRELADSLFVHGLAVLLVALADERNTVLIELCARARAISRGA
ncbi:MAG TPA: hypothetical protein VFH61_15895 [Thermoleophilia bacterium]|nr:hypothetical protein [Thermoleophilia bacterium]